MDKILKFFKKLWLNKERLVLVIALGFLALNIYRIFDPTIPDPVVATKPVDPAPAPLPDPLRMDPKGQFASFVSRNPFSYYSDSEMDTKGRLTGKEAGIKLIAIKSGQAGKWRARLKTKSTKWYDEGDSFETFVLEEIDPEGKRVVVYATEFAKTVTLELKE